jgi:hypothetical protein
MKITKNTLRKIVKEELKKTFNEQQTQLPKEVLLALEQLGKSETEVGIGSWTIAGDIQTTMASADLEARNNSPTGKDILKRVRVDNILYSIAGKQQ